METTDPVKRLSRDEVKAGIMMGVDEVRFLVSNYYTMQDNRIRANNQLRALAENDEPNLVLTWLAEQNDTLEKQIKRSLDKYSSNHPVGKWMRSIDGVGPVIASGILSHIDIHKAPTAGHIWSFAGLVPGVVWAKGQKRPWNAELKRLFWLLSESFVKVSGKETAFYGHIYKERKEFEIEQNEKLAYKEQAENILKTKKIGKETEAYKAYAQGKLPAAHIHARAKRYAVKLFISHLHHVWYVTEFGVNPPNPYVIDHMGHAHVIVPPNFPMTAE